MNPLEAPSFAIGESVGQYRLGVEAQRIKRYVMLQLNGQETVKNEQILKRFQRQAQQRRHHHINKHNSPLPLININKHCNVLPFLNKNSQLGLGHQVNTIDSRALSHSRYLSLQQRLQPKSTDKRYSFIKRGFQNSLGYVRCSPNFRTLQVAPHSNSSHRYPKQQVNSLKSSLLYVPERKRSLKRGRQDPERYSTDSSELMEEAEHKLRKAQEECQHWGKQIRRFKRYRKYLGQRATPKEQPW